MAAKIDQHFVPQYYFRQFSDGRPFINVLLKGSSTVVPEAAIKGQCARRRFYGSPEIETAIGDLDTRFAETAKKFARAAHDPDVDLTDQDRVQMVQACVFQRQRTLLQATKNQAAMEQLMLRLCREQALAEDGKEEIVSAIDNGEIRIVQNTQAAALRNVRFALESAVLLGDLEMRLLLNVTDRPFLFGDSPVVFYNSYLRLIDDHGVLGFQCPGLLVFWPLDPATLLLLIDGKAYRGRWKDSWVVPIVSAYEIAQMNALQLYHSSNAVYFGDWDDRNYVLDLWFNHSRAMEQPRAEFRVRNDMAVRGRPVEELWQTFEPQLKVTLDLSFFTCVPLQKHAYRFRYRSPELANIFMRDFEKRIRKNVTPPAS